MGWKMQLMQTILYLQTCGINTFDFSHKQNEKSARFNPTNFPKYKSSIDDQTSGPPLPSEHGGGLDSSTLLATQYPPPRFANPFTCFWSLNESN